KTAFDIEAVVGLPLLGIVPEIKKLGEAEEMAQNFTRNPDREAAEAFATLYSAMQLKEESKNAQCILVTSTVAGEGKSFITTHLAKTYASHGMKTVIVDCDLRRPAVQRVFHLENLKGVIDVVAGEAKLDEVIVKNMGENLDVILTGGRSKSPTQALNSKAFALMLSELRKRYDRVFLDTPPVAIVSDALVLLPLVDGSIYSIYFNKARRKAAQYCAQRVLEANVPNFGAVLNGLKGGVGGYYYSHHYDKSYKQYYVNTDDKGLR
ncbi:MAG TPA: CpsD/CapB family tyrosine-protein kinase, partial [Opitutaceae bacterium]|nr:CpsD/CapB family tyrosine-protein kinase [Opitutaceae bacterium]